MLLCTLLLSTLETTLWALCIVLRGLKIVAMTLHGEPTTNTYLSLKRNEKLIVSLLRYKIVDVCNSAVVNKATTTPDVY